MKYLEEEQLVIGKYYHCVSYNDEDIVVQYFGLFVEEDDSLFSTNLTFKHIRYVLCEVEDLREKRKAFE